MLERGNGSVKRQRASMENYVEQNRISIFSGGPAILMSKLDAAAEASTHRLMQTVPFPLT